MEVASQAVHTVGINWESLSVVLSCIVAMTTAIGAYIRRTVKGSVDHLADVLTERLETKANVAALTTRITVLEEKMRRR